MDIYRVLIFLSFFVAHVVATGGRGMMFKEKWRHIQASTETTRHEIFKKNWKHIGGKKLVMSTPGQPQTAPPKKTAPPTKSPQQILKEIKEKQLQKKSNRFNGRHLSLEEQMINTRIDIETLKKELAAMLPHHFKPDPLSKSSPDDIEKQRRRKNPKRVPMRPRFIMQKMMSMKTDIEALREKLTTSLDSHPKSHQKKDAHAQSPEQILKKLEEQKWRQNSKRVPRRSVFIEEQVAELRNMIERLRDELTSICFTNAECGNNSCCLIHNMIGKCVHRPRLLNQRCSSFCPCASIDHQCKNKKHFTTSGKISFAKHCLKKKDPEPVNTDLIMELGNAKRSGYNTKQGLGAKR